jgi:hypothetical protein
MEKKRKINPKCTPMDILAVIQSIQVPPNEAINEPDNPFINTAAQKIIAKEFSTADSTAITNLNKKFEDIKFNELDTTFSSSSYRPVGDQWQMFIF